MNDYVSDFSIVPQDPSVTNAALFEMRTVSAPFKLGEFYFYLGDSHSLWPDTSVLTVEFQNHSWLDFAYTFSKQDKLYNVGDPSRLGHDFGRAWAAFFREQQIDPPEDFGLGEN